MEKSHWDPLGVVAAAYAPDVSDSEWLAGVASACQPGLDAGFGLCALEFHYQVGSRPRILQKQMLGMPAELEATYPIVFENMDPELQQRPFLHGPCTTGSQMMGLHQDFEKNALMQRYAQRFGIYDSMWITAAEPSGWGVGVHAGRPRIGWASHKTVRRWTRIAAHLSAGARLRRRIDRTEGASRPAPGQTEAILTPLGRVEHAEGQARSAASRERLRESVLALEAARCEPFDPDRDTRLTNWKGLVDGRWTLLDLFESDGKRYIVAKENAPAPAVLAHLTLRERQVVGFAALGHENKVIAYDLGIAHATVRVLMARAASKLGARSRVELISAYQKASTASSRAPQAAFAEGS